MADRQDNGTLDALRRMSEANSQDMSSRAGLSRRRRGPAQQMEAQEGGSTLPFRVAVCAFLFVGYCFMAKEERAVGTYDSAKIQEMIEEDTAVEAWVQTVLGGM